MDAERLNAQAAMEILQIRNDENDMWKLDLHGLHASEATKALREHLQKIEGRMSFNCSISPCRNIKLPQNRDVVVRSSSFESSTSRDTKNSDQSHACRQRSSTLQVITGIDMHSSCHWLYQKSSFAHDRIYGYKFKQCFSIILSLY